MPVVLQPTPENIASCAERLRRGLPVAFPTETVYGLGCDASNEAAITEVYQLKRRPGDNPLIAHVTDIAMAKRCVLGWDVRAQRLAEAFWPGPLAIILPRRPEIRALSVGGRTTVAVRAPAHPVAQALIAAFGKPVSAPSANRSGRISPTSAAHVASEFPDAAELSILEGGPCEVGLESTVIDLSRSRPTVLRPGAVTLAQLGEVLGEGVEAPHVVTQSASPGTSASHYAPETACELVAPDELAARLAAEPEPVAVVAASGTAVPAPHRLFGLPSHDAAYAQLLYATLREADAARLARILVVLPPSRGGLWDAALDRLRRASARRG